MGLPILIWFWTGTVFSFKQILDGIPCAAPGLRTHGRVPAALTSYPLLMGFNLKNILF